MKHLRRLPPFVWSLGLVGAALVVSLALPVPAQAASETQASPMRAPGGKPEEACLHLSTHGRPLGLMQPVSVEGSPQRLHVFVQAFQGSGSASRGT